MSARESSSEDERNEKQPKILDTIKTRARSNGEATPESVTEEEVKWRPNTLMCFKINQLHNLVLKFRSKKKDRRHWIHQRSKNEYV